MPNFRIVKITAFVAVDPKDGDEGIIGAQIGDTAYPLISADEKRAAQYYPIAKSICERGNKELKVLQFEQRVDVTEKWKQDPPNPY